MKEHGSSALKKPKSGGWANSVSITKMARRYNLLNCPTCNKNLTFYDIFGFWWCKNCMSAGDIKDFAQLIVILREEGRDRNDN